MKKIIMEIIKKIDKGMECLLGICIIFLALALIPLSALAFIVAIMVVCGYPQYCLLAFALIMVIYAIVKYAIVKPYLRSQNSNKKGGQK